MYYFADKIGGELLEVYFPAPMDVDPAYWVPGDSALAVYQSADIILSNGAHYDQWMDHVSLPSSRIVNTTAPMKDRYIELTHVTSHSHGPEGDHEHTGFAFTTWLKRYKI